MSKVTEYPAPPITGVDDSGTERDIRTDEEGRLDIGDAGTTDVLYLMLRELERIRILLEHETGRDTSGIPIRRP